MNQIEENCVHQDVLKPQRTFSFPTVREPPQMTTRTSCKRSKNLSHFPEASEQKLLQKNTRLVASSHFIFDFLNIGLLDAHSCLC
jgi:hypothetical protein